MRAIDWILAVGLVLAFLALAGHARRVNRAVEEMDAATVRVMKALELGKVSIVSARIDGGQIFPACTHRPNATIDYAVPCAYGCDPEVGQWATAPRTIHFMIDGDDDTSGRP